MLQIIVKRIKFEDASRPNQMYFKNCKWAWFIRENKRKATKILQTAEENKISAGKDPMGLPRQHSMLHVTNGENKTQEM